MTETRTSGKEIVLGQNNYGKSEVRVFKVDRDSERHKIWDLDIRVVLEGDFEAVYLEGDNTGALATDTMRNTCYALAKDNLRGCIEDFGLELVDHFLQAGPTVTSCWVEITQYLWNRIEVDGKPHKHSFIRNRGERRAKISGDESGARRVQAGISDIYVLKTTNSGWEGFLRDQYTTLPDTNDRILATVVTAIWWYDTTEADFDRLWQGVHDQTLATFTDHYSPSVQNTLWLMGRAVLTMFPEVEKIWYSFPNVHHIPFDLDRFGMENNNEIFHATHDPYGQIEGFVERR
jgi:urate oxidase